MQIQNVPITSVKPYEKNPRFRDGAFNSVAWSIMEFNAQPTEESRAVLDIVHLTFATWGIFA